jgi:hypothetical protein
MNYIGINSDPFFATKNLTGKFKEHPLIALTNLAHANAPF